MLRKNIRLRREYIFNKEQSKKNREENVKKLKMKKAYDGSFGLCRENKKLPTELYKEREELEEKLLNADDNTLGRIG